MVLSWIRTRTPIALLACLLFLPLAGRATDGVTRDSILVGQAISLEEGRNTYGVAVLDGVTAYLQHVNAQGGVLGRQVRLKTLDDMAKPPLAEAHARSLVQQDKVFLIFGSIEGGPSTAVMKAAIDLQVPFFGPMAGSPTLRRPHQPLVFPVRSEHRAEFRSLLQYARSTGTTRVAFVRSDSATGLQHLENVQILAKELNMEVVADLPFKSDIDAAGLTAMAKRIGSSGAQVVINHGGSGMYEQLIRTARAQGIKASFTAVNSGSAQLAANLGPLAHGMVFTQVVPNPMERKTDIAREYQDVFSKLKPGKPFSYGSLEGYITAKALVESLKLAGREPTRESFVQGLHKAESVKVNGLPVRFRPGDHAGLELVDLAIYTRDGRFRH